MYAEDQGICLGNVLLLVWSAIIVGELVIFPGTAECLLEEEGVQEGEEGCQGEEGEDMLEEGFIELECWNTLYHIICCCIIDVNCICV
mmetsp:Transcript_39704/g.51220  ORF Transcript_39704/g.51220 Transcript_39704/m.51220 type:complete len:88 (+) Transcript_39704:514-777(+)